MHRTEAGLSPSHATLPGPDAAPQAVQQVQPLPASALFVAQLHCRPVRLRSFPASVHLSQMNKGVRKDGAFISPASPNAYPDQEMRLCSCRQAWQGPPQTRTRLRRCGRRRNNSAAQDSSRVLSAQRRRAASPVPHVHARVRGGASAEPGFSAHRPLLSARTHRLSGVRAEPLVPAAVPVPPSQVRREAFCCIKRFRRAPVDKAQRPVGRTPGHTRCVCATSRRFHPSRRMPSFHSRPSLSPGACGLKPVQPTKHILTPRVRPDRGRRYHSSPHRALWVWHHDSAHPKNTRTGLPCVRAYVRTCIRRSGRAAHLASAPRAHAPTQSHSAYVHRAHTPVLHLAIVQFFACVLRVLQVERERVRGVIPGARRAQRRRRAHARASSAKTPCGRGILRYRDARRSPFGVYPRTQARTRTHAHPKGARVRGSAGTRRVPIARSSVRARTTAPRPDAIRRPAKAGSTVDPARKHCTCGAHAYDTIMNGARRTRRYAPHAYPASAKKLGPGGMLRLELGLRVWGEHEIDAHRLPSSSSSRDFCLFPGVHGAAARMEL
ncbi:hypothetical protein C8Q77DRAFT_225579 [Trametes polyzona]|nr:hypothetical protein C8Q77DRAFT_225579 [Trametes polyzona]